MMKRCTRCGVGKLVEEDFYKRASQCKVCIRARVSARYKANPQPIKDYIRDWQAANPEARKRYYRKTVEAHVARARKWKAENPEKRREITKRWDTQNGESRRRVAAIRRTRVIKNGGSIEREEWSTLFDLLGTNCLYCGCQSDKLVMDHFVPVARGGRTEPGNLIPCCEQCNRRKGAKMPSAWLKEIGEPDYPPDGFCTVQRFLRASRRTFCGEVLQADEYEVLPPFEMPISWVGEGYFLPANVWIRPDESPATKTDTYKLKKSIVHDNYPAVRIVEV